MSYKPNVHQLIPGTSGNQVGNLHSASAANLATLQSYRPLLSDYGPPSLGFSQGSSGSQVPQNKYAELLAIIEEIGKEIRPTYAGSKSAMERLKREKYGRNDPTSKQWTPLHGLLNMSTDDSISEDVSSLGALSHCPDGGKESETSLLSSEATSASGLVVSEGRHTTSQTTGATVESRPVDITPACKKIRSLCLSTDEGFVQDKRLPFINPSSLETLRALVQEIQNSGETDPEIWKDCQGRWLHLFRLVEKQYQDQILAQQEQYQCQIQLIQDEIKAMVQLQNRQASNQSHTEFSPNLAIKTSTSRKECVSPLCPSDSTGLKNLAGENALASPAHAVFTSHALPLQGSEPADQTEEWAATGLSSGYGTLFARETSVDVAGSPREDQSGDQEREKQNGLRDVQQNRETTVEGNQQGCPSERIVRVEEPNPFVYQQENSGISQPLTSWAQRQKLRVEKIKMAQPSSQNPDCKEQPCSLGESHKPSLPQWPESQEQEPRLSLKEIYHNKQRTGLKHSDCEGLATVSSLSPQMLTLDPSGNQRQSDHTSGFTSPSHFSSPSFHLCPSGHTPVSPDSMGEYSPNPADTDAISDSSSVSAARPSKAQSTWGFHNKAQPCSHTPSQQHRVSAPLASEEEGSNTHTSTLIPCTGSAAAQGSAASLQMEKASSLEDPVVLSLVRQRLREKHARHVADLKAYYETEIQLLQDKLKLGDLPQDVEKANETLTKRCKHLEKALSEATRRVQELEATNSSLEKKLAEWPERYAVAGAAVKSLQQRLDESKRSEKEKDATVARLKSHARQLEEELQKARRDGDEKDSKSEREYKMLQDLLGEYESLRREHEELKNNLVSTENKLCDANDQISELKSSPSEGEHSLAQPRYLEQSSQRREKSSTLTPVMRALIELEEAKATESRAPWSSTHRTVMGSVERRHKDAIQERLELQKDQREAVRPGEARAEGGPTRGLGGAETAAARLRAQRSLSPESHRSSSLPPAHRNGPPATPTKRETLLMPQSAKSSPKRCPTENFSTVFGCMMPREEYLLKGGSPRRRLQFMSADRGDGVQQLQPSSVKPAEGSSQQGWEEPEACPGSPVPLQDRLHSLAEAERLLDELTQEKMQIEAALSQLPRTGAKVSLQARLDEAALEKRLERVNRQLGSIRMTLKRFHVLRSSANI
ncbi:unnamed protein product [Tetraodon nigroviridis]|uniref:(spotted green pufferfish) hypothetical protein n=1 Tax=Tetraodon nigroviridis TaxID=99883 RepID=Q4S241_TETNG|nr:unnamed protein product [Tetraodon nigroviridis]